MTLQSYSEGRWQDGTGQTKPLHDAATGEQVTTLWQYGPDVEAMLSHARNVGGPAVRALTFTERAAILRSLAKELSAHLDEFAALSTRTGATRRDTEVDVDGGIATMAVYASRAARELPDRFVLADGDIEPLGKGGTFAGRHILSSKVGAAVHINAFNFPVWGMLEKFAPAFLAGMPSVVKPAGQTAFLTELVVRRIVESGQLPAGSLSLLCAGPGRLMDNLTSQDTVSFTGSASTAAALRSHPVVIARSVAINTESDSLNCSILGLDITPDAPEFELYVHAIVTEMTVKAGQKCTAIRRAFVPDHLFDAVTDALVERLSAVTVGHPDDPAVEMGPVVSRAQREEVLAAVGKLTASATVVAGGTALPSGPGAFLRPILLRCDDIDAAEIHEVEAFGPVATLLPYRNTAEVVRAAARGDGSLVGSIVTADQAIAGNLISCLAPWHGRLLVLNEGDAAESTGHGVAMPQLLHGGPGRAGGGQELGGLRALEHYMQRTAVQGHPGLLQTLA